MEALRNKTQQLKKETATQQQMMQMKKPRVLCVL
jgi:hypothetical protein